MPAAGIFDRQQLALDPGSTISRKRLRLLCLLLRLFLGARAGFLRPQGGKRSAGEERRREHQLNASHG